MKINWNNYIRKYIQGLVKRTVRVQATIHIRQNHRISKDQPVQPFIYHQYFPTRLYPSAQHLNTSWIPPGIVIQTPPWTACSSTWPALQRRNISLHPTWISPGTIWGHQLSFYHCYLAEEANYCFTTTSFHVIVESDNVSPQPPLLQTGRSQFCQPHLIRLELQSTHQICYPSLETLQGLNIFLLVRGTKLNTALEMWPHQCWVQRKKPCTSSGRWHQLLFLYSAVPSLHHRRPSDWSGTIYPSWNHASCLRSAPHLPCMLTQLPEGSVP